MWFFFKIECNKVQSSGCWWLDVRRGGEPVKGASCPFRLLYDGCIGGWGRGRRSVQCGRSVSRVTKANYGPPAVPGERRVGNECMGWNQRVWKEGREGWCMRRERRGWWSGMRWPSLSSSSCTVVSLRRLSGSSSCRCLCLFLVILHVSVVVWLASSYLRAFCSGL